MAASASFEALTNATPAAMLSELGLLASTNLLSIDPPSGVLANLVVIELNSCDVR